VDIQSKYKQSGTSLNMGVQTSLVIVNLLAATSLLPPWAHTPHDYGNPKVSFEYNLPYLDMDAFLHLKKHCACLKIKGP
jgi:hypothetical protein